MCGDSKRPFDCAITSVQHKRLRHAKSAADEHDGGFAYDRRRIGYDRAADYRARYYEPGIGRFLSEDPIGFKGGSAFYSYVRGSIRKWLKVEQSETVSGEGFTLLGCSRFCVGEGPQKQQTSTTFTKLGVTGSTETSCELQISIGFNKPRNRVRDQGVAGSNPVSPTILFQ